MEYHIRQIDPDFWHLVKVKCLAEKTSIRAKILDLLEAWLKGD